MRKAAILFLISFYSIIFTGQVADNTIDDAGDIAIIAYHDEPDGFSFVFLDNCPDGTDIRFVDEEWTGNNFASSSTEGEVLWSNNTGQTIMAGTVVHIENANDNNPGIIASIGIAIEDDGGFTFTLAEDEVIAITGTRSNPGAFLGYFGDADTAGSTLPSVLTNGETAIYHSNVTEGYYNGPKNCNNLSLNDCAKQLNNINNWTFGSYNYPQSAMASLSLSSVLKTKPTLNSQISFYPNPTQNRINISCPILITKVSVLNLLGKQVLQQRIFSNKTVLNLEDLPTGNYLIKCDTSIKTIAFNVQKW